MAVPNPHHIAANAAPASCVKATGDRKRRIVGIADLAISSDPTEILTTYALGSCLGIAVYDPEVRVAGLLHFMLPNAAMAPDRAATNPLMFADTGLVQLFRECYNLGAKKERMLVNGAGGATFVAQDSDLAIGQRNVAMLRKLLWTNGVLLRKHDFGGAEPRTMSIDVGTGVVTLNVAGVNRILHEGSVR